jgi:hypothetical protein
MYLVHNSMQSGKIVTAQPGTTVLDPFVAIAWGIFGFREPASDGGLHLALGATGGALMVAGAFLLSGSPILEHRRRIERGEGRPPARGGVGERRQRFRDRAGGAGAGKPERAKT